MMDLEKYGKKFDELGIPRDVAGRYAESFNGKIFVVKGGGEIATNQYTTAYDLVAMHDLGIKTIFVHGGKERIDQKFRERGLKSEFVGGYRITTPEGMEAVEEALDEVNWEFRKEIRAAGGNALGLKEVICAVKHAPVNEGGREIDLGLVGEPKALREGYIMPESLYDYVLVISPVSLGVDDNLLYNTNADDAASFIASQLGAEKLIYLSNEDGVIIDGSRVSELTEDEAERHIDEGHIDGGMVPKVMQAVWARKNGVEAVQIINGKTPNVSLIETYSDKGIGTMVA